MVLTSRAETPNGIQKEKTDVKLKPTEMSVGKGRTMPGNLWIVCSGVANQGRPKRIKDDVHGFASDK